MTVAVTLLKRERYRVERTLGYFGGCKDEA